MTISQAVIMAGGRSTRLRPYTSSYPKPLLHVRGRPLLHYAVRSLQAAGVTRVVFCLGFAAEKIRRYFTAHAARYPEVEFSSFTEDQPLGTGGAYAVLNAQGKLDERFFAINADIVTNVDLGSFASFHQRMRHNGALATMLLAPVPLEDVHRFGVADVKDGFVRRFVEKPKMEDAPSNLINAGRYILEREALATVALASSAGVTGFSMEHDFFPPLAQSGRLAGFVPEALESLYWNDVGTLDSLHRLSEDDREGRLEWLFDSDSR